MMKWANKMVRKMDAWDVGLDELAAMTLVLLVLSLWPAAVSWMQSVSPWWFVVAIILLGIRPVYRVWLKK